MCAMIPMLRILFSRPLPLGAAIGSFNNSLQLSAVSLQLPKLFAIENAKKNTWFATEVTENTES